MNSISRRRVSDPIATIALQAGARATERLIRSALSVLPARMVSLDWDGPVPDCVVIEGARAGMDTCQRAATLPAWADVLVLVLTRRDDAATVESLFEAGVSGVLRAPYRKTLLARRVRRLLENASILRELGSSRARLAAAQRLFGLGTWVLDPRSGTFHACERSRQVVLLGSDEPASLAEFRARLSAEDRGLMEEALRAADGKPRRYRVQDGLQRRVVEEQIQVSDGVILGTVVDVTERVQREQRIEALAYTDPLTGLPNRSRFTAMLDEELARGEPLAVILLHVDRLRRVNDSFGHVAGDELLGRAAARLGNVAGGAGVTLARFGGNDFALRLLGAQRPEPVLAFAYDLLGTFREPFVVKGHEVYVSGEVGVALAPEHGQDSGRLLRAADLALGRARHPAQSDVQVFVRGQDESSWAHLSMEAELRRALERDEFIVYYQPKLDISSGRIIGCEALIRWRHPERGLVSPGQFIPVAEESGLIAPMGAWVLRQAAKDLRAWADMDLLHGHVAVNVAAPQFVPGVLVEQVRQALDEAGVDASSLELEVTESLLMENLDQAIATMAELREMGVSLAIDDFGTGYSSLRYLRRFPIQALKVDRSFVMHAHEDADDATIVRTIVELAHSLSLHVVAEGVEEPEQLALLDHLGCDLYQGFLASRPVPFEDFCELLRRDAEQGGLALGA